MNPRRLIALSALALLGLGALLFFLSHTGFRVVKQDPAGDVAMSSTLIKFTLSDAPTNPNDVTLAIEPRVEGKLSLTGNTVSFEPGQQLKQNQSYRLTVANALLGDAKRHTARHSFKAVYIPYDRLPAEERARQQQKTNPTYNKYPITKELPHVTALYKIEYSLPEGGQKNVTLIITPLLDRRPSDSDQDYQQTLLSIKAQAEAYLKSKGYQVSDYPVYYANDFLMQYTTALSDYAG